jgi:RNA polymerase sigma factor (sigma-70 family)
MSIVQAIPRPGARRSRPVAAEDAKLIGRMRAGDARAFEAIFKRHHAPLLSYARHMLANQDEAEDVLQQAFIKAHRALLGGTVPRELRPWLYAIVRNCCLSAIAARRHTVELDERAANLAGLTEAVYEREDLRELLADIGRLPEDQRSALLLAELDDLSHQSIATIVGCPVSKVKALIYQARSALIADRDARSASCGDIREELAVARAGELRRAPLRRHLKLCVGCRDFQQALATQRRSLAIALPVLPSAGLAAKILSHSALQAASSVSQAGGVVGSAAAPAGAVAGGGANVGAAASTAATGAASTAGGGGVGAVAGGSVLAKVAVGGAVVALATTGAVTTVHHLAGPHPRHSAHVRIADAQRSLRAPGAQPETQSSTAQSTAQSTAPSTLGADVSAASSDATVSGSEASALATSEAVPSGPLSQATPQSPQTPTLTSALSSSPATSATMTPLGTQTTSGQRTLPQRGASHPIAPAIHRRRRLERQQREPSRLRRHRQAERKRLEAEKRRLAREERRHEAQELKEAKERRERLREERRRKAQELKEAKERRERLLEERQRQARELKEAREHRELEAQRKREQREAAATTPKPSTQTTQSSTPVTTTTTATATETSSTEATGTEGKRKRKKS